MENEKYLPELFDKIKLVGFNKEQSTYDNKNEYFTSVEFITSGDTQFIQQRLQEDISLFDKVRDVLGVKSLEFRSYIGRFSLIGSVFDSTGIVTFHDYDDGDKTIEFRGVKIKLEMLQKLIDSINSCFSEIQLAEIAKQKKIVEEESEFEHQINKLKF